MMLNFLHRITAELTFDFIFVSRILLLRNSAADNFSKVSFVIVVELSFAAC